MRKPNLKEQNIWMKFATLPAMLVLLTMVLVAGFPARANQLNNDAGNRHADASESGLVAGIIGVLHGQYVKVSALNQGNKAIPVKLVFVDENGKVLIFSNDIVSPGKAFSATFTHPGGVNRIELYAQIRTESDQDLKNLVPSVQIIDTETGKTEIAFSGSDFFSFRPFFNPPLVEF